MRTVQPTGTGAPSRLKSGKAGARRTGGTLDTDGRGRSAGVHRTDDTSGTGGLGRGASALHTVVTEDAGERRSGAGVRRTKTFTGARGDGVVREPRAQVRLGEQSARLGVQLGQRRQRAHHGDSVVDTESIASAYSPALRCQDTCVQVGAVSAGAAAARKKREATARRMTEVV
jgi:hypothetical protein